MRRAGLLVPIVLMSGCGLDGGGSRTLVRDSAGVRITTGPGEDVPLAWEITRMRAVTLPDAGVTPPPWMIDADPGTGRAWVVDRAAARVHVFDTAGTALMVLGRSGRGPFELSAPVAIDVTADGVVVADAGRQQLVEWTFDGEPVEERPLPQPYWGPGFAEIDDAVVMIRSVADNANPTKLGQELVRIQDDTAQVLAALPQRMSMLDLPCLRRPVPMAFAASILWSAAGDRTYHVAWPEYRIDIHEGNRFTTSVRRDIAPMPVTDSMAVREIETGQLRVLLRMCGIDAPALLREIGTEPYASPVSWLAIDPEGALWVWRSFAGGQQVDVFDAEGEYLGSHEDVPMPVAFLSREVMLGVRDPFEEAVLEMWRVVRR